jgi:hypothetical protein
MSQHKGAKKGGGAADVAAGILAGSATPGLDHYIRELSDGSRSAASQAARVLEEVVAAKPALATPHIARLARLLSSDEPRVAQGCANSLPELARFAPAKVAKHLAILRDAYPNASEPARDGIVRTFVALCLASIAYQKRLIDVLERALQEADDKTLGRWTELVLPALKGEPYARARAVVEQRLPELSQATAKKIADFLGIRLRPSRIPGV